jgi:hypothetical protein
MDAQSPSETPRDVGPDRCLLFTFGHRLHRLQGRKCDEEPEKLVRAVVESIDGRVVRVRAGGSVRWYQTHDPQRLRMQVAESAEVVVNESWGVLRTAGRWTFSIAQGSEPWTACSPECIGNESGGLVSQRLVPEGGFMVTALSAERERQVTIGPPECREAADGTGPRVVHLRGRGSCRVDAEMDPTGSLCVSECWLHSDTAAGRPARRYGRMRCLFPPGIPRLVVMLGGAPEEDVLDVIERDWANRRAEEFLQLLRLSDLPIEVD